MDTLVIVAPNWLGDAVMALPAIADVRRRMPKAAIAIAARASVAALFGIVPDVDEVIDPEQLDKRFATAILLPNSFRSAWLAAKADIHERWGYRTQLRGALLTRAVARPARGHQVDYYRFLVDALGFPNGSREPKLAVPAAVREAGAALLREAGCTSGVPVVAIAPGAAYGGAKRWPADSFGQLARELVEDGVHVVIIGTAADSEVASEVTRAFGDKDAGRGLISLVGRTDLPTLAGVLANCRALVANDSGAMHLAAAVGTRVTAVFGPTNERATSPVGDEHAVLIHRVWCRPCMLRECPIDHRCMRGIVPAAVADATRKHL